MNPDDVLVLRFRDLVTEVGGTIEEHLRLLGAHGAVWWGWWMRQYETRPSELFAALAAMLDEGFEPLICLVDTGQSRFYQARLVDLRVALPDETIGPPDLASAPEYYQRGSYPAWFKLGAIEEVSFDEHRWTYASLPTRPQGEEQQALIGQVVGSLEELRQTDATLWVLSRS